MPNYHFGLLLVWIILGAGLRLINLEVLPPWTDEFATMVFSLGNSFYDVPLNQFIDLPILMEPLQLNPSANINDVVDLLLTESTHPPLYFALTHLWLKLFPAVDGQVSVWAARSLSAGLGVMGIPAIFGFTRLIYPSPVAAQLAAGIMAISPFGIFLSTQARHYSLIILFTIATLSCFVVAYRSINRGATVPLSLILLWIGINCLGVASHYFFVLVLASLAIALIPLMWRNYQIDKFSLLKSPWRRLYLAALGSLAGCLVWLPSLLAVRDSSPTDWIYASNASEKWLEPIGRFLLWLMSTVILLPSSLYDYGLGIVIAAGVLTLIFWLWCLPPIVRELRLLAKKDQSSITPLINYLWTAIALFFATTYFGGMDLTLAGRFQFVYFPVVIVLIALGLEQIWSKEQDFLRSESKLTESGNFNLVKLPQGQKFVICFLVVALISAIVANLNRGYLQNHRPDLMSVQIAAGTTAPPAIATSYIHHGQTGRIMGLAWGLKKFPQPSQFFLASDVEREGLKNSTQILAAQLATTPRPLDLWLINFRDEEELGALNCQPDSQYRGVAGQYKYRLYRCRD